MPEGRARLPPADDSTTLVLPSSLSLSLSLAILTGLPLRSRRDCRWQTFGNGREGGDVNSTDTLSGSLGTTKPVAV